MKQSAPKSRGRFYTFNRGLWGFALKSLVDGKAAIFIFKGKTKEKHRDGFINKFMWMVCMCPNTIIIFVESKLKTIYNE